MAKCGTKLLLLVVFLLLLIQSKTVAKKTTHEHRTTHKHEEKMKSGASSIYTAVEAKDGTNLDVSATTQSQDSTPTGSTNTQPSTQAQITGASLNASVEISTTPVQSAYTQTQPQSTQHQSTQSLSTQIQTPSAQSQPTQTSQSQQSQSTPSQQSQSTQSQQSQSTPSQELSTTNTQLSGNNTHTTQSLLPTTSAQSATSQQQSTTNVHTETSGINRPTIQHTTIEHTNTNNTQPENTNNTQQMNTSATSSVPLESANSTTVTLVNTSSMAPNNQPTPTGGINYTVSDSTTQSVTPQVTLQYNTNLLDVLDMIVDLNLTNLHNLSYVTSPDSIPIVNRLLNITDELDIISVPDLITYVANLGPGIANSTTVGDFITGLEEFHNGQSNQTITGSQTENDTHVPTAQTTTVVMTTTDEYSRVETISNEGTTIPTSTPVSGTSVTNNQPTAEGTTVVYTKENLTSAHAHMIDYHDPEFGGLVAALVFGCLFLVTVIVLVGKRCYDGYQRRHYTKMDYLVNGMYN